MGTDWRSRWEDAWMGWESTLQGRWFKHSSGWGEMGFLNKWNFRMLMWFISFIGAGKGRQQIPWLRLMFPNSLFPAPGRGLWLYTARKKKVTDHWRKAAPAALPRGAVHFWFFLSVSARKSRVGVISVLEPLTCLLSHGPLSAPATLYLNNQCFPIWWAAFPDFHFQPHLGWVFTEEPFSRSFTGSCCCVVTFLTFCPGSSAELAGPHS